MLNGFKDTGHQTFDDSTLVVVDLGPTGSNGAGAGRQTFSWDLQLWQLVTLEPFKLQTLYLQYWKI